MEVIEKLGISMRFLTSIGLFVFALVALGGSTISGALAQDGMPVPRQLGFQPAATPVMEELVGFHFYLLILITIIVLFVTGLLAYVCIRFNAKSNPVPSRTTHNTLVEVAWTVLPILILVAIAVPSFRLLYKQLVLPEAELTVKATGYQWYWGYEYPDNGNVSFESNMVPDAELNGRPRLLAADNPLVVPVDTNVRVIVTGADVIHAFAVPAFGVKIDAVPGRLNETWFKAERTGIFYGQCSELCGQSHAFMPIEVHVVSKEEFAQWLETNKQASATPADITLKLALAKPEAAH